MIVWKNKSVETHYDESLYMNNTDAYIVTNEIIIQKVRDHAPYFDLVIENGELIDVIPYNPISATTDKPEILADGADTATITATVDDATSTETIELYHNEILVDSKPAVNGVATFGVAMTETGILNLTVKSTTKYGKVDVTIEGV